MSTKKFLISLACALAVLLVLSTFTILFVGAKTHRTALLGTWTSVSEEALASESITFNTDDTYLRTTVSTEGIVTEEGTFSIFNGKIKMVSESGEKEVLTYKYDRDMRELEIKDMSKAS